MNKLRMSVTLIIICIFLLANSISSFADNAFNNYFNDDTNNKIITNDEQKTDSANPGKYDPLIDNKEESELKKIYKSIKNDYKDWDVSWNDFLSDYIKTEASDPGLYYKTIKSALDSNENNLRSQSEPPAWYYNTGYSLPQSADYSSLRLLSSIKKGDIIYENNGGSGITGHIAIVEGIYYSTLYDQFYIRIIESIYASGYYNGVCRSVLDSSRVMDKEVAILRVNHPDVTNDIINNAVRFCQSQIGKPYYFDVPAKDTSPNENDWYCSELIWAAFKNQGIDLEVIREGYSNEPGVSPHDLFNSIYVSDIDFIDPTIDITDCPTFYWAHDYIFYNVENGLMNGVEPGYFMPEENVSRAMFITMLYRLAGTPTDIGSSPFTDVPSNSYYYHAVSWAVSKGIVNGISPTEFNPNGIITREDITVMMYRYCRYYLGVVHYIGMDGQTISDAVKYGLRSYLGIYSDYNDISEYARQSVSWAVWNEIMSGTSPSQLSPKMTCTRAQAATFMYRFVVNYLFLY